MDVGRPGNERDGDLVSSAYTLCRVASFFLSLGCSCFTAVQNAALAFGTMSSKPCENRRGLLGRGPLESLGPNKGG